MKTVTCEMTVVNIFEATPEDLTQFFANTVYTPELLPEHQSMSFRTGILWHQDGRNRILVTDENIVVKTRTGVIRKVANKNELARIYGVSLEEGTV